MMSYPIVPDEYSKFCDCCLEISREMPPKAIRGGIFDQMQLSGETAEHVGTMSL